MGGKGLPARHTGHGGGALGADRGTEQPLAMHREFVLGETATRGIGSMDAYGKLARGANHPFQLDVFAVDDGMLGRVRQ